MKVRTKFECTSKTPTDGEEPGFNIGFNPVTGGSEENDSFYKYTPGGDILLSTVNESAAAQFEVGKTYYVDFTPAN